MNAIHTLDDFLRAYQDGQRHFTELELEYGPRFPHCHSEQESAPAIDGP